MEDLILSRLDYGMLALFVVALLFVVVFVISKQSKPLIEHPVRSLATTILVQDKKQVVAWGLIFALLGFFVLVTLLYAHPEPSLREKPGKVSMK